VLAETFVASLLMPFLKKGGEKAAEALGETLGKGAGERVREAPAKAWKLIGSVFRSEEELTTLKLFQDNPERYRKPVEEILDEKMEEDPSLRKKISELLETHAPQFRASIHVNRSKVQNSTIIGQINSNRKD